tara:strand:+ start:587 stop:874 length:288 start_codon:yes stop_codon:yes gene_type:complete
MIGDCIRVVVSMVSRRRVTVHITRDYGLSTATTQISSLAPGKPQHIERDMFVMLRRTGRRGAKLGFKAPINVPVHRQEIYDKIAEAEHDVTQAAS